MNRDDFLTKIFDRGGGGGILVNCVLNEANNYKIIDIRIYIVYDLDKD